MECELLIRSIAKKFYNVESEDLYQAGCLGLIKAYNNYKDPNVPFSSFAYKYIFGEMYELYLKTRNIKMNRYYLSIYKLLNKTQEVLTNKMRREVTDSELAEYLNISEEDIVCVRTMMDATISLDDEYNRIEIGLETDLDTRIDFEDSLSNLDPLSSEVMNYRLKYDLTQTEISKILGISQVKVSRIEASSKDKILEYIS